jgi:hypothetical protein
MIYKNVERFKGWTTQLQKKNGGNHDNRDKQTFDPERTNGQPEETDAGNEGNGKAA